MPFSKAKQKKVDAERAAKLMDRERKFFADCRTVTECLDFRGMALGYNAWHWLSERLGKQGVKQARCGVCQRWPFPHTRCPLFVTAEDQTDFWTDDKGKTHQSLD